MEAAFSSTYTDILAVGSYSHSKICASVAFALLYPTRSIYNCTLCYTTSLCSFRIYLHLPVSY